MQHGKNGIETLQSQLGLQRSEPQTVFVCGLSTDIPELSNILSKHTAGLIVCKPPLNRPNRCLLPRVALLDSENQNIRIDKNSLALVSLIDAFAADRLKREHRQNGRKTS